MITNKKRNIISILAKNTIKADKGKFLILFLTIVLSSFMLFCIFTIGITYLDLSRMQDTRLYGGEFDITVANGFTDKQLDFLNSNEKIESVGIQAYSGSVKSTDSDDTVNLGLLYSDEVFWKQQHSEATTSIEGNYPTKFNELMVSKEALEESGKSSLNIGDIFTLTYEDNNGVHTNDFIISGIWEGYGNKSNFYVSEDFYNQSGFKLDTNGILYIKFNSNFVTRSTIDNLEKSLELQDNQVFQASSYIENSLIIFIGVCGLCFIICLSAYLLIYNILYLSISSKIRYYGLLQALGMTKKELVKFIKKQMFFISALGIIVGSIIGIVLSLFLLPYVMNVMGISNGNIELVFNPFVLILSILTTVIAILFGIRKPIKIATSVTPVEATRYYSRNYISKSKKAKKHKKRNLIWNIAKEQLMKDKKKTIIVFLSLATSLSVFYCLTTLINSQGERTVIPNYWDADLIIRNYTQTENDINSLEPAIDSQLVSSLSNLDGVKEIHSVTGVPIILPYVKNEFTDMWIKQYISTKSYMIYDEIVNDYQNNPENYYGMIKAIDEEEFDYLNELLGNKINKKDFLEGKVGVIQFAGFEIPPEYVDNENITFYIDNQPYNIVINAINYDMYYGGTSNIGVNIIVSKNYLEQISTDQYILNLNVKYDENYDVDLENKILSLIDESSYSNDLYYESKYENMKTIQEAQGNMMEIGVALSLLLLFVGTLNYINTIVSNIQIRKLTFATMESIGMTEKQIIKLLISEGLIYAIFSILITATIGTLITYIAFQTINYANIPFAVPIIPLLIAILLVILICIITPLIAYKRIIGKKSIIDRLREYD